VLSGVTEACQGLGKQKGGRLKEKIERLKEED